MEILPVKRITVTLDDNLRHALARLSREDRRPPKKQIEWLIESEAKRRGLATKDEAAGPVAKQFPAASQ